jgi:fatty acid desaturase
MRQPQRVKGVVTLGTPFLRVRQRSEMTLKFIAASYAFWTGMLAVILLALILMGIGAGGDTGIGLAMAAALLLWIVLYFVFKRFFTRSQSEADRLLDPLDSVPKDLRILSLRHGLDEASTWLALLAIPRSMDHMMSRISERSVALLPESDGATQAINLLGRIPVVQYGVMAYLAVCYLPPIIYIIATAPIGFVGAAMLQHRLGFGGRFSFSSLRMYLSIHGQTWVGTSEYRRFSGVLGMIRAARCGEANSPHSMGYSDPKAVEAFCSWIGARHRVAL